MVRHRKRITTSKYDEATLKKAVNLIHKSKRSIYDVSKQFNIPKTTLKRWVNKTPKQYGSGRPTVLNIQEEKLLVKALLFTADCGLPLNRNNVKNMVQSYVKATNKKTPFNNGRPGPDWMLLFEHRHAVIVTRRKPELLTLARAEGLTEKTVNCFFDMYEKVVFDDNLHDSPECFFNLDEIGLNTDIITDMVFVRRDSKNAYIISPNSNKTYFTVLFCVSATGVYLPPFTIYKSKHLYKSWTTNGVKGATYACSPNRWMMDYIVEQWFIAVFVPFVSNYHKPVLLTYDGHNSHLTYTTVKTAMDNQIIIVCLPPNTSHATQPLDVAVFRSARKKKRTH